MFQRSTSTLDTQRKLNSCMIVYTYNSKIGEVEAGELQFQDQPGLYNKILSQKKNKLNIKSYIKVEKSIAHL